MIKENQDVYFVEVNQIVKKNMLINIKNVNMEQEKNIVYLVEVVLYVFMIKEKIVVKNAMVHLYVNTKKKNLHVYNVAEVRYVNIN